jgi:hypothetical protein
MEAGTIKAGQIQGSQCGAGLKKELQIAEEGEKTELRCYMLMEPFACLWKHNGATTVLSRRLCG